MSVQEAKHRKREEVITAHEQIAGSSSFGVSGTAGERVCDSEQFSVRAESASAARRRVGVGVGVGGGGRGGGGGAEREGGEALYEALEEREERVELEQRRELRLEHVELGQMLRRVRAVRAECWRQRVHTRQSSAQQRQRHRHRISIGASKHSSSSQEYKSDVKP